jgi:hypothetical protein
MKPREWKKHCDVCDGSLSDWVFVCKFWLCQKKYHKPARANFTPSQQLIGQSQYQT